MCVRAISENSRDCQSMFANAVRRRRFLGRSFCAASSVIAVFLVRAWSGAGMPFYFNVLLHALTCTTDPNDNIIINANGLALIKVVVDVQLLQTPAISIALFVGSAGGKRARRIFLSHRLTDGRFATRMQI